MNQDRAAFEELHLFVLIGRHLTERLFAEIVGWTRVERVEQLHPVRTADLLQRPPHAKIAHEALSEIRNPAKGRDFRGGSRLDWHGGGSLAQISCLKQRRGCNGVGPPSPTS